MNNERPESALEAIDAELQALRIGLKIITAALSTTLPNGELAKALEEGLTELKEQPGAPERALEYLGQMANVARKAIQEE